MMKLSDEVLLEIVEIVREGISEGKDISEMLRNLELKSDVLSTGLFLTDEYKNKTGRKG